MPPSQQRKGSAWLSAISELTAWRISRPCRKRRSSSRDDGGVSWVFWCFLDNIRCSLPKCSVIGCIWLGLPPTFLMPSENHSASENHSTLCGPVRSPSQVPSPEPLGPSSPASPSLPATPKSPPTRRVPPRGTPRVPPNHSLKGDNTPQIMYMGSHIHIL